MAVGKLWKKLMLSGLSKRRLWSEVSFTSKEMLRKKYVLSR